MNISEVINSLNLQEMTDESISSIASKSNFVRIDGILLARTADTVILKVHDHIFKLSIDAILDLDRDPSQLSPDLLEGGIAVRIAVRPRTELIEIRKVFAERLSTQTPIRPLVFALPSEAEKYATTMPEDVTPQRQTPYSSTKTTPYQTGFPTGNIRDYTPDTTQDTEIDSKNDDPITV